MDSSLEALILSHKQYFSLKLIPRLPSVSRVTSCYTAVSPGSRRPSRGSRLTLVPGTRYLCIFPGAKIYTVSSTWWRRVYFLNSSFPGLYPRCTVQLVPATLTHRALSGCTWLPPEEEKPGISHVLVMMQLIIGRLVMQF